jgi:hypothetical protein
MTRFHSTRCIAEITHERQVYHFAPLYKLPRSSLDRGHGS